jgi:hypothetical protein
MRLLRSLEGGDRRSIGAAGAAARKIAADRALAGPLLAAIAGARPVVRMRAADALEKATRVAPVLLAGHEALILELLSAPQPREIRWHLLQLAPRIRWRRRHFAALLRAVERCFTDASSIVRTSALQALFELARRGPAFARAFRARVSEALLSGTPAMRARARRLAAVRREA